MPIFFFFFVNFTSAVMKGVIFTLNEELKKYLETSKEIMKKYVPEILCAPGIAMSLMDISHVKHNANMQILKTLADQSDYYRLKYIRKTRSNNWLRIHGYPMRRKGH